MWQAVSEQNAGADHAFVGPAMVQCQDWWRLAGKAGRAEGHEDAALGRCLLQALSTVRISTYSLILLLILTILSLTRSALLHR